MAGTAAMAAGSLTALAAVALLAPQDSPMIAMLPLIALAATALEQLAWRGIDNLSVPLLVSVLWRTLA